jgi:hypothetical protein
VRLRFRGSLPRNGQIVDAGHARLVGAGQGMLRC